MGLDADNPARIEGVKRDAFCKKVKAVVTVAGRNRRRLWKTLPMTKLLAFDLGAESGRAVLGHFDGSQLRLEVLTRFANEPVRTLDALHWDVLRLHHDMLNGMRLCAAEHGGADGVGVDTWGVDFALLGRSGELLGNPRHYRDPHTEGAMERAFAVMPRQELFRQTGIQFMRFNSLFQLLALKSDDSPLLEAAETLLFMPDLFHYFFTGEKVNEYTDASTSQMLDPATPDLGDRSAACVRIAGVHSGEDRAARHGIGAVAPHRGGRHGPTRHESGGAGDARHGGGGGGGAGPGRRVGVYQFGNVVADGRGNCRTRRSTKRRWRPTSPMRAASAARFGS